MSIVLISRPMLELVCQWIEAPVSTIFVDQKHRVHPCCDFCLKNTCSLYSSTNGGFYVAGLWGENTCWAERFQGNSSSGLLWMTPARRLSCARHRPTLNMFPLCFHFYHVWPLKPIPGSRLGMGLVPLIFPTMLLLCGIPAIAVLCPT